MKDMQDKLLGQLEATKRDIYIVLVAGGEKLGFYGYGDPRERAGQFMCWSSGKTMIQGTLELLLQPFMELIPEENGYPRVGGRIKAIVVVTSESQRTLAREQLSRYGIHNSDILVFPPSLGYTRCINRARAYVGEQNRDAVVISSPVGHYIPTALKKNRKKRSRKKNEPEYFAKAVQRAALSASSGNITAVGTSKSYMAASRCRHIAYSTDGEDAEVKQATLTIEKPSKDAIDLMKKRPPFIVDTGIIAWPPYTSDELPVQPKSMNAYLRTLAEKGKLFVALGGFRWSYCVTLADLHEINRRSTGKTVIVLGEGKVIDRSCGSVLLYSVNIAETYISGLDQVSVTISVIDGELNILLAPLDQSAKVKSLAKRIYAEAANRSNDEAAAEYHANEKVRVVFSGENGHKVSTSGSKGDIIVSVEPLFQKTAITRISPNRTLDVDMSVRQGENAILFRNVKEPASVTFLALTGYRVEVTQRTEPHRSCPFDVKIEKAAHENLRTAQKL